MGNPILKHPGGSTMWKLHWLIFVSVVAGHAATAETTVYCNWKGWPGQLHPISKAKGYAFEQGILVRGETPLTNERYRGALFFSPPSGAISTIATFVNGGGRAAVFVFQHNGRRSDSCEELLGFGTARENDAVLPRKHSASASGGSMCRLWGGLTIAAKPTDYCAINLYLTLGNPSSWSTTSLTSNSTHKTRTMSAYRKFGNGELLVLSGFYSTSADGSGGSDLNIYAPPANSVIDLLGNKEATLRLFSWLAGRRGYN
jgi:hypothetical protein